MIRFLTLLLVLSAPQLLRGTQVGVGTIEQPVNLGAQADQSRIPLGPVPFQSNYSFGVHRVITKPRPSTHGGLEWEGGLELNMNLASAFGIVVEPTEDTLVLSEPVVIRVKDWSVPAYSPYTKKQVVAATLHCLLRSVHATAKKPLKVEMVAENPDDAAELKGFGGDYITAPEAGTERSKIPGTSLVTDERGVTWVVFADAKPPSTEALRRMPPVMVPFHYSYGDWEYDFDFQLVPIWVGDTWSGENYNADERNVIAEPTPLFYDLFDRTRSPGPNWNVLNKTATSGSTWHWHRHDGGDRFRMYIQYPEAPSRLDSSVAASCYAAILTALPTESDPLEIQLLVNKPVREALKIFEDDPEWKVGPGRSSIAMTCQFVWDRSAGKLSKGSVPGCTLTRGDSGGWFMTVNPAVEKRENVGISDRE